MGDAGRQQIDLGTCTLLPVETPGHCPDHIAFLDPDGGILFTGDMVYRGHIFVSLPDSDRVSYVASVNRLNDLCDELGHDSNARLDLATLSSVGWAVGFGLGNAAYFLQGVFENRGAAPTVAFQYVVAVFAVVFIVALYLPVVFIPERKHAPRTISKSASLPDISGSPDQAGHGMSRNLSWSIQTCMTLLKG